MANIKKFGQYVLLQVHNESGELVFETDSLKIEFDVRHIKGWSRAKITLTNLAPDTIRKLGGTTGGNFVTVQTKLHDGDLTVVADKMYVSNTLEEIKVPDSVFSMYCYSKLRRAFLEKQVDVKISTPTLPTIIEECLIGANFTGPKEFKHFPPDILSFVNTRPSSRRQGSLISILENLGEEYRFNTYTEGNKLVFMYKPDNKNVEDTDFYKNSGDIKLSTTNMRSNPKIGPATLSVVSNLDPRIKPSTVLDISELLTLGTDTPEETLQVAEDYLREKVSGFSKYQTLSVQHKGSNWTSTWITQIAATSPNPGTDMPTVNWWA